MYIHTYCATCSNCANKYLYTHVCMCIVCLYNYCRSINIPNGIAGNARNVGKSSGRVAAGVKEKS